MQASPTSTTLRAACMRHPLQTGAASLVRPPELSYHVCVMSHAWQKCCLSDKLRVVKTHVVGLFALLELHRRLCSLR